jgi:hypothetical protein
MSETVLVKVYVWPDSSYCYDEELEEYLQWKSDDYIEVELEADIDIPTYDYLVELKNQEEKRNGENI